MREEDIKIILGNIDTKLDKIVDILGWGFKDNIPARFLSEKTIKEIRDMKAASVTAQKRTVLDKELNALQERMNKRGIK